MPAPLVRSSPPAASVARIQGTSTPAPTPIVAVRSAPSTPTAYAALALPIFGPAGASTPRPAGF